MNSFDIGGADAIAIRQPSREIVDAANRRDLNRMMGFFRDDIVYIVPGRRPSEGWSAVKAHYGALHTTNRNEDRSFCLKAITHHDLGEKSEFFTWRATVAARLRRGITKTARLRLKHFGIVYQRAMRPVAYAKSND